MIKTESDKNKDRNPCANCPLDIARGAIDKIGASEEAIEKREEASPRLVGLEQGRGSRRTREGFHGSQDERRGHHGVAGQLGRQRQRRGEFAGRR